MVNRRCVKATKIKGIDIPEGMVIAVDVLSLHNDPNYWENPEEFNPSRFSSNKKINPYVYCPFGIGPRVIIFVYNYMVR